MLRGGKGEEGCHKCGHTHRQTDTQTEKGVNPTSRYSTGFSTTKMTDYPKLQNQMKSPKNSLILAA